MLRLQHYILLTGEEIADLLTVHFIHVKLVLQILFSLKKKDALGHNAIMLVWAVFPTVISSKQGEKKR